jgi:hypothetical protein
MLAQPWDGAWDPTGQRKRVSWMRYKELQQLCTWSNNEIRFLASEDTFRHPKPSSTNLNKRHAPGIKD